MVTGAHGRCALAVTAASVILAAGTGSAALGDGTSSQAPVPSLAEERAVAAGRAGDWARAVAELDGAIATEPANAELYFLRGAAYAELARPNASKEALANPASHDLAGASTLLARADADLKRYIELAPSAAGNDEIRRSIATNEMRKADVDRIVVAANAEQEAVARRSADQRRAATAAQDAEYERARESAASTRTLGWVLGSFGVASGVASAVCGALWAKGTTDISAGGFATGKNIGDAASRTQLESQLTLGFAGGAALFMTVGVVLVVVSPTPARSHSISIAARPSGIMLSGEF